MIITDKFIYIHMPKTGGTFVTKILEQIYGTNGKSTFWEKIRQSLSGTKFDNKNKHGFCFQIPSEFNHLPVVGCVRNPYDRYVSQYTFSWWRTHAEDFPGLREHPRFPDLTFEDFVYLANEKWLNVGDLNVNNLNPLLGWHTIAFITYYCDNPAELLNNEQNEPLTIERIKKSLRPQTLLRTNQLNQDLYDFLLKTGFSESNLDYILTTPKIMPREGGRSSEQKWEKYYTPELKSYIRERESLLFALFPEFND